MRPQENKTPPLRWFIKAGHISLYVPFLRRIYNVWQRCAPSGIWRHWLCETKHDGSMSRYESVQTPGQIRQGRDKRNRPNSYYSCSWGWSIKYDNVGSAVIVAFLSIYKGICSISYAFKILLKTFCMWSQHKNRSQMRMSINIEL